MPKKPRKNQGSNPAGVNRKQNYPRGKGAANNSQQGNGQFYCANHGSNTSHNTDGCRQDPKKNDHTHQGQKRTCTQCGKNGHVADDCWANKPKNERNPQNETSPPPPYTTKDPNGRRKHSEKTYGSYYSAPVQNAAENYCGHCNVQGHNPTNCNNVLGMYQAFRSRLFCLACNSKGHMADDCNNPLSAQCISCFRKGHSSSDCKLSPDRDAQLRITLAARNTKQRYVWRHPEIKQHPSQEAASAYEEAKKHAALSGVPITVEDDLKYRRNIALASDVFGTNPFIENAKVLGAGVRSNTSSRFPNTFTPQAQFNVPNATSAPGANVSAKESTIAKQRVFLDQMRRGGHSYEDISRIEELFNTQNQQEKTAFDKAIAAKIDASTCYAKFCINDWIRMNEAMICTATLLPQSRMDEIKNLMRQGGSVFRDPAAMRALFDRHIPRCTKCSKDGFIVNQWFNVVEPTLPKAELLKLMDMVDWGLFVFFHCSCSRTKLNGYGYHRCSIEHYNSLPDEEK